MSNVVYHVEKNPDEKKASDRWTKDSSVCGGQYLPAYRKVGVTTFWSKPENIRCANCERNARVKKAKPKNVAFKVVKPKPRFKTHALQGIGHSSTACGNWGVNAVVGTGFWELDAAARCKLYEKNADVKKAKPTTAPVQGNLDDVSIYKSFNSAYETAKQAYQLLLNRGWVTDSSLPLFPKVTFTKEEVVTKTVTLG